MNESSKVIRDIICNAEALLITAGAGMGVDSGLPDFRGNEGFWKAYPPIAKLGISFSEMANPYWFDKKPELAWAFYGHRLNLYRKTVPHNGFKMLLDFGKKLPGGYFVFTSNVDGQFQKAGFDENRIEEVHGSIHHFQCSRPCSEKLWDAKDIIVRVDEKLFKASEPLPRCPYCGAMARPNILMFGDWKWVYNRAMSQSDRLNSWLLEVFQQNMKLLIIELGAGLTIPTVRMKSESTAKLLNGNLIRVNRFDDDIPPGHFILRTKAKEGIENILKK